MSDVFEKDYGPHEEDAAEYLSENSWAEAINEYLHKGDGLFWIADGDSEYYGLRLARHIDSLAKQLQFGVVLLRPISDSEFEDVVSALQLPHELHYDEFKYVVTGGDYDNGKFRREEKREACEETDVREAVVKAIAFFALQAATFAKKIGSEQARKDFTKAYLAIQTFALHPDCQDMGCSKERAGDICRWIAGACGLLWADVSVIKNLQAWNQLEENMRAMTAEPPSEALDAFGSKTVDESLTENEIALGTYAAKIVKQVDSATRTIVFFAKDGTSDGETLQVPPKSNMAWRIFKCAAESGEKNGEAELPEDIRSWHGHFRRTRKFPDGSSEPLSTDLVALHKHLVSCKGAGKRGLPVIRLKAW